MHAAQLEGAKWSALWKLAVLAGAGMLALALATPARADDQSPPAPLMLAKTAVIAPDEPDATMPSDANAPEPDSAPATDPDPAPARVLAVKGWELAAKQHVVHRRASIRMHAAVPSPVVSTHARPVHAARPHRAAGRAHSAAAAAKPRWYQLARVQYRDTPADSLSGRPDLASWTTHRPAHRFAAPRPAPAQRMRTICELRLRKCLQFCSRIAIDNVAQNERWIGACISSRDRASRLDRVHELLLRRLWSLALDDRMTASGQQYQSYRTQYQSAAAAFGWEAAGAQADRRTHARQPHAVTTRVASASPRPRARVLATVATHPARVAKSVGSPSRGRRSVEPAAQSRAADDWLLRSLVALIGLATLALLLSAGSALPAVGTVKTRLASKGLSAGRIDLGRKSAAAPPRGSGISYRD